MSGVANKLRRALGREPEPTEPRPLNLRAAYRQAALDFIAAKRSGNKFDQLTAINALHHIRQRAIDDNHAEAMARVWITPEIDGDQNWLEWYAAKVEHFLHNTPDPGKRPAQPWEPEYWIPPYVAAVAALLEAHRSRDPRAITAAEGRLWQVRQMAIGEGHGLFVERHFIGTPLATDETGLQAWKGEVAHRLAHGAPSGKYHPPPRPLPFVRVSDVQAAEEARHSAIVLLAPHDGMDAGTWVRLDPGVSHQLVEDGRAAWARDRPLPEDTRPPIEQEPGSDWIELEAAGHIRLASRHRMAPGDVRRVPPDEAKALIAAGVAEAYVPPPPPRELIVFE